jgi:alpha-D-ribose 1-methylphosphonate 5-triphosphate diphosphatase
MALRPRVVAVIAAGRLVYLTEASRVMRSSITQQRKTVAAA